MTTIDIKQATDFVCCFKFKGKKYSCKGKSIDQFINGFWVPGEEIKDMEGSKIYWINPSRIKYISAKTITSIADELLEIERSKKHASS